MLLKCLYNNWFACRLAWIINLTDFKRKARMQLQWNPALWWYRSPHYYGHFFWPLAKRPYIFLQKKPLLIRWPINTAKFFTPLVTILMGFHCSVHLRHIILKYLQWIAIRGICGTAVNTLNSRSGGLVFKSCPSCCFLRKGILLHFVSLHPGV